MFREWGFLLGEIWVLLALAALVGLIAGWLFWGRRPESGLDTGITDRLRADLEACRAQASEKDSRIAALSAEIDACRSAAQASEIVADDRDLDGDGIIEGTGEGTRPEALEGPRPGGADDLKRIKGIGPKMEKLCNSLGFYHFDQIAGWSDQEVAWVDANLEGFKGRVTRDDWVAQAKVFSTGGETAFSKKVDKGEVY